MKISFLKYYTQNVGGETIPRTFSEKNKLEHIFGSIV